MVDPFFDDYPLWILQKVPEVVAVGSLFRHVQLDLSFTIVTEDSGLDHAGEADGLDYVFQTLSGVRVFKRRAGKAALFEKILFALAMLAGKECAATWEHGFDGAEHVDHLGGNVFKLKRDHVDAFSKFAQCSLIRVSGIDFQVSDHTSRTRYLGLKYVESIAEITPSEYKHAPKLPTTENSYSTPGIDHASGNSVSRTVCV